MTSPLRAYITSLSPQGFWPFSETSGTVATDFGALAKNGTYTNSPDLNQPGLLPFDSDPSIFCDPATDEYVYLGGTTSSYDFMQNTAVFTWGLLIKLFNYASTSAGNFLFVNNGSSSANRGIFIAYDNRTGSGFTSSYRLMLTRAVTNAFVTDSGANGLAGRNNILDNNVHFLVVTGDGNMVRTFIDGVCIQGDRVGTLSTGSAWGEARWGRGSSAGGSLHGNMQYGFILNTAMTNAQVRDMYWMSQSANATIADTLDLPNGTYRMRVYDSPDRNLISRIVWNGNITVTGGVSSTVVHSPVASGSLTYCVITSQTPNQLGAGVKNTLAAPLALTHV